MGISLFRLCSCASQRCFALKMSLLPPFPGEIEYRPSSNGAETPVASLITAVAAIVGFLWPEGKPWQWVRNPWAIAIAIFIFVMIRFPKVAIVLTRIILGPAPEPPLHSRIFRGPSAYGLEDEPVFCGRQADADDCWVSVRRDRFLIIEGESGCGKSSLLNAALLPRAEKTFQVFQSRISHDPFGKLQCAISKIPYPGPNLSADASTLREAFASHAARGVLSSSPEQQLPLLLCIDQAEEFFLTVPDEARFQLLSVLKESIEEQGLTLIFSIRSDFVDLLIKLCREVDPLQRSYLSLRILFKTANSA
jgi:hypothetical protein